MLAYCVGENKLPKKTKEKIIRATVELVNEKGYKGATTRAIADRAGVNEVTLFRHFGNKKGIVEAAVDKFSFSGDLVQRFEKEVIWDIEHDLKMLSRNYLDLIEARRDVILISIKEGGAFPELDAMLARVPQKMKKFVKEYLLEMINRGKLKEVDVETVTTSLLFLNFGYFLMKTRISAIGEQIVLDEFIENHVGQFIKGLQ